jgi:hypothetical protein
VIRLLCDVHSARCLDGSFLPGAEMKIAHGSLGSDGMGWDEMGWDGMVASVSSARLDNDGAGTRSRQAHHTQQKTLPLGFALYLCAACLGEDKREREWERGMGRGRPRAEDTG